MVYNFYHPPFYAMPNNGFPKAVLSSGFILSACDSAKGMYLFYHEPVGAWCVGIYPNLNIV